MLEVSNGDIAAVGRCSRLRQLWPRPRLRERPLYRPGRNRPPIKYTCPKPIPFEHPLSALSENKG